MSKQGKTKSEQKLEDAYIRGVRDRQDGRKGKEPNGGFCLTQSSQENKEDDNYNAGLKGKPRKYLK